MTSTLAGLRPVYGPISYHGLGSVLGFPGVAPLLRGVDLQDSSALVRALTFGATQPVFSLSQSDITGLQSILRPL